MKDKAIIYDHNCPMCSLYTKGFVKWGLLENNNRLPFASVSQQEFINRVDWRRAKHEIPLVDLQGGQTLYGLHALTYVLGRKMPWLSIVLRYKPLYKLASHLYNLVSYNRRIIVPAKNDSPTGFDCTPDFHRTYRLAFILLAIFSSVLITYAFGQTFAALLGTNSGGWQMLLMAGTGWAVQLLLAWVFLREKCTDYISHLAVIMLIGVLVLLPGILFGRLTSQPSLWIPLLSVLLSSSLMCRQHVIRARSLGLPPRWTFLWFAMLQTTALFWIYLFYIN
jgi:predicted DCC family thiol-disulfide oxidoreductase YuxK